jgi:hypothetical protein
MNVTSFNMTIAIRLGKFNVANWWQSDSLVRSSDITVLYCIDRSAKIKVRENLGFVKINHYDMSISL